VYRYFKSKHIYGYEDFFLSVAVYHLNLYKSMWFDLACGNVAVNFLKPSGHYMYQQFNIQQLYALPTLYLCVLYLSENKQRLVPITAQTDWFL